MISDELRETAQVMLWELNRQRLVVALAPPIPGTGNNWRRVVEERNPEWYREFCADWPSRRSRPRRRSKPDTRIKRAHTLRALREIANGKAGTEYAKRILPYVEAEAQKWEMLKNSHAQASAIITPQPSQC